MSPAERSCRVLDGHPWLAGAWASEAGIALLLNADGLGELHRQGRQSLLDALQASLVAHKHESPRHWRLLDVVPEATDAEAIDQLLQIPRPRVATPLSEQCVDGCWKLRLRLPLELIQFDGHFRKAPVLPGVIQAGWALALAVPRLGTATVCREMEALKFQRLLRPGDQLELSLRYEDEPGAERGKLHFAYHLDGAHCSSGRLRVARTHV